MLSAQKIKELIVTQVDDVVYNVPVDNKSINLRVKYAPNSCTSRAGERCVWLDSVEGCPRLCFCLNKCASVGKRNEFVCYIEEK